MARLPRNYLSKTGGSWRTVRLLDLAILLVHVHRGAVDDDIGHLDARETLDTLTRKLNKEVGIDPSVLESALFSANLADEQGKFWHPSGITFENWVKSLVGSDSYNRIYGTIERKE